MNRIRLTKISLLVIFISTIIISLLYLRHLASITPLISPLTPTVSTPTPAPSPTPKIFKTVETYNPPKVRSSDSYTILFVGDSMTSALGENFDQLRIDLTKYYPDKVFGLFNYGFGSTNIFSVEDRLHKDSNYLGKTIPSILGRYFDIIIIESFAYNPLSEFGLTQGLIHQNETLNKIVAELVEAKPDSLIIFMATIAPTKEKFALGSEALSTADRIENAQERINYLLNAIVYANKHNIPLINVYEKSLDKNRKAELKYINPNDYIHPSAEGIKLISQQIADYFDQNNILPK